MERFGGKRKNRIKEADKGSDHAYMDVGPLSVTQFNPTQLTDWPSPCPRLDQRGTGSSSLTVTLSLRCLRLPLQTRNGSPRLRHSDTQTADRIWHFVLRCRCTLDERASKLRRLSTVRRLGRVHAPSLCAIIYSWIFYGSSRDAVSSGHFASRSAAWACAIVRSETGSFSIIIIIIIICSFIHLRQIIYEHVLFRFAGLSFY